MCARDKYNPVVQILPATERRKETFFRIAGDGFLEVGYGRESAISLEELLVTTFRTMSVNSAVRSMGIRGLIETVPATKTILYAFDPTRISVKKLIENIIIAENGVQDTLGIEITARVVRLPLVFDDSETRKAIGRYLKNINPSAPNCEESSNLKYIAMYNGITVEEFKQKFLQTKWLVAMVGFFPGLPFTIPLDPCCAVTAPKYNPARTWTGEGTVDLADFTATIFPVPSGGGYQLIGRTAPIFQTSGKHPQFKENPILFKPTDMIQYYEVSEEELLRIYDLVHGKGEWRYDITEERFSLKEWLESCEQARDEVEKFRKQQEKGKQSVILP